MVPGEEPDRRPDINRANQQELAQMEAIDVDTASAIVKYREEHGRIGGPEDLERVPGINPNVAQQIRGQVRFL